MKRNGETIVLLALGLFFLGGCGDPKQPAAGALAADEEDGALIPDPSFEQTMPPNQFGQVFPKWHGWKYEGDCEFRVSTIAHSGKTSCLLFGASQPKIRIFRKHESVPAGRYKITAYLRGLDIGVGRWKQTTEFAFDEKYIQLKKNGTFGWTKLTYVTEVSETKKLSGPSFGLMAPGFLWVDDVEMVRVGNDVPLTPEPVLSEEAEPFATAGQLGDDPVRCPLCAYQNPKKEAHCYACGEKLQQTKKVPNDPVKPITSFEEDSWDDGFFKSLVGMSDGATTEKHATKGAKSYRLDRQFLSIVKPMDWSGYDFLVGDFYVEGNQALDLYVEIRDKSTTGYWTRVNLKTVVSPGANTVSIPIDQLFVGEKARPGRKLLLSDIERLVLNIGETPVSPLYIDNLRLERDLETPAKLFEGLHAFDLGLSNSPLMPGFTRLDPSAIYTKGRGYGLKDVKVWRSFDALQPEPLYQDFICIERGGLAVDLPNGTYRVFINMDNPSGYWGEYQVYEKRTILAEGQPMVDETMSFESFKEKYFRFWDVDDTPGDDTFDKYQQRYFDEKEFEVTVSDGQLNLEFSGRAWACSVSAIVLFPVEKKSQGVAFLEHVTEKRRALFNSFFKRVLHQPKNTKVPQGESIPLTDYVQFTRDYMEDVYYDEVPLPEEIGGAIRGAAFAGEKEPLTFSIYPRKDLGEVTISVSDLVGPATIGADAISVGYVSNRIARVTDDGTVYTISPRLVMPKNSVVIDKQTTRRFWLTVTVPRDAAPGVYRGQVSVRLARRAPSSIPIEFQVYPGQLAELDIPVGPWGHQIDLPWLERDPRTDEWNRKMARKSMVALRENGFTSFTGLPILRYRGFEEGRPVIDFEQGDEQMKMAREVGFTMPVVTYKRIRGLDLYYKDERRFNKSGQSDYTAFIKAIFSEIHRHAEANNWLPVYWNIGDEPLGKDLKRAIDNSNHYRDAFPAGPPYFTAATSFATDDEDDERYQYAKTLHIANLCGHSKKSVEMIREAGSKWAYYNDGNRFTYGIYMYKAAKQYGMAFRLHWHWNLAAGDPYYALDCRADDYAWANAAPDGSLIMSVEFEREMREGIDDYRYLHTLAGLAKQKNDAPATAVVKKYLDSFELGQNELGKQFSGKRWREFRREVAEAIGRLRAN